MTKILETLVFEIGETMSWYFFIYKISNSFSLFLEDWLDTRRKINQARLQNLQKTCQAHPELSLHEEMHNAQAKSLYTSPAESYLYQGQGKTGKIAVLL